MIALVLAKQTQLVGLGGFAVWGPVIGAFVVLGLAVVLLDHRAAQRSGDRTSGRVIGVVGRMGSGKSYFAVRMAHNRMRAGAQVVTNFSMTLPAELAGKWRQFNGWEQFAELEDCVVIIDEAHLYAPSSQHLHFPMIARFKLAQARKFGLDVYWISQHEDRVNRTLRDLTNMIYVCRSFFDGKYFSANGYEPEKLRRKDEHIDRRGYRFDASIANLYDTLEILDVDEHVAQGMAGARKIGQARNAKRAADREHRSGARSATAAITEADTDRQERSARLSLVPTGGNGQGDWRSGRGS